MTPWQSRVVGAPCAQRDELRGPRATARPVLAAHTRTWAPQKERPLSHDARSVRRLPAKITRPVQTAHNLQTSEPTREARVWPSLNEQASREARFCQTTHADVRF